MKRLIIKLFLSLCLWAVLPVCAQDAVHYYFRTMDIRNGLSQNTVYQILQDRKGFMWFGTKDGLNRYDGLSFRIYKKENSGLGKNFITALYEDRREISGLVPMGAVLFTTRYWIPLPLSMRPVITAVSSGISSP
mgnify:CR=1 FL=1